jgi:hypothetical protein
VNIIPLNPTHDYAGKATSHGRAHNFAAVGLPPFVVPHIVAVVVRTLVDRTYFAGGGILHRQPPRLSQQRRPSLRLRGPTVCLPFFFAS